MRVAFKMLLIVATISLSPLDACAEEGSHYFPGALSSFIDMLPVNTGSYSFGYSNDSIYYHGSNNHLGLNATTYTNSSAFLYQFPGLISILPGSPQYSVALGVPYTWLKVHAPPVLNSKGTVINSGKDTDNGFGDVAMFPFMLGWTKAGLECTGDEKTAHTTYVLKYQTQFGIYAPTGNFEKDAFANIGRNFWTFEPTGAVSYLLNRPGKIPLAFEFTSFAGFDFNTRNSATRYQTGDQFHLDGTLAVHLGVDKDTLVGAGASGFFYQQITRDSVRGVSVHNFEAMTTGVGPELSFAHQITKEVAVAAEVKWLPELSVSNRLQGNAVWFKVAFAWINPVSTPNCPVHAGALAAPYTSAAPFITAAPPSTNFSSLYTLSSF